MAANSMLVEINWGLAAGGRQPAAMAMALAAKVQIATHDRTNPCVALPGWGALARVDAPNVNMARTFFSHASITARMRREPKNSQATAQLRQTSTPGYEDASALSSTQVAA